MYKIKFTRVILGQAIRFLHLVKFVRINVCDQFFAFILLLGPVHVQSKFTINML